MKKNAILFGGLLLFSQVFYSCKKTGITNVSDETEATSVSKVIKTASSGSMVIENLNGAITTNEKSAFKNFMATVPAPTNNDQNVWVFGSPGKNIEACGLMYEATGDIAILDRMIYYCDAALAGRNDLASAANGGQRTVWTGQIEPVWPSSAAGVSPAQAGVEPGMVAAHIAYCAKLILGKSAIWNTTVAIGDPKGFGTTYKARALKYIQECDYVMDNWIIPRFVRSSDKKLYFPGSPNTYKPNQVCPWNQMFFVTNGMIRLIQCHLILNDAASRITQYDGITQANISWFKADLTPNTSVTGSSCWKWKYAQSQRVEDSNHAAYDVEGFWLAYDSGRYGITLNDITLMANTYFDLVLQIITNGVYAGRLDGTTGTGNESGYRYIPDQYLYLADIRKEKYFAAADIEINNNRIWGVSPPTTARLLWLKNRRYLAGIGNVKLYGDCSYGGWNATFDKGDYLMADIIAKGGVNDGTSSLKVPPGMKVALYPSNTYGGTPVTFTADDACLNDNGINDQTSSLKITTLP